MRRGVLLIDVLFEIIKGKKNVEADWKKVSFHNFQYLSHGCFQRVGNSLQIFKYLLDTVH